ncbi:N alpha-acetyl-transferase [Tilletia horrida]|nr:N alpha-acetyl-transferase [Tilletia horrida]KAK0564969.1 N alpha-acetyl-transferase [Tilletia horrida]
MRSHAARKAVKGANALTDKVLSGEALAELNDAGAEPTRTKEGIHFKVKDGRTFLLSPSVHTASIPASVKTQVFDLLRTNMFEMYSKSRSIEWKDEEKLEDVNHPSARLITAFEAPQDGSFSPPKLAGYVLFRFDADDCDSEDPCVRPNQDEVEVAYCYELQISQNAQGCGLGKLLMRILERYARFAKMRKVVLTCFEFNTAARAFYTKIGYTPDLISPATDDEDSDEEEEEERPDYRIMSKAVVL